MRIDEGQRKGGKAGKILGFASAALGVAVLVAAAAFALRSQKPLVEVAQAQKAEAGGRAALLNASGYVTPRRRATIAAKITGRVTGVFFDEGTHVREGQLLATLDDSDVKRALDSARADRDSAQAAIADFQVQLRNAEIVLGRAEKLQKAGVQTQEALDNASTAADSLKAKIDLAKKQVVGAEVVVSKDAQVGEMVSPISAGGGFTRTGIATIVDMNSNEIEVDVNESYIARVQPGQQVKAVLDAYPDWEIPSRVRTIIPSADRQKATVKVRISFVKLDPRILPDMGIKVTFLGEEVETRKGGPTPAALVPNDAVRDDNGKKVVFLLKDERVERRAVTTGGTRGTDTEILAGLVAGDTVVVKGPANLQDGQGVQIKR